MTTKVWNDDQGYDATLRAFDASATRLDVGVVDLYLIHWPVPSQDLYLDSWRALPPLEQWESHPSPPRLRVRTP